MAVNVGNTHAGTTASQDLRPRSHRSCSCSSSHSGTAGEAKRKSSSAPDPGAGRLSAVQHERRFDRRGLHSWAQHGHRSRPPDPRCPRQPAAEREYRPRLGEPHRRDPHTRMTIYYDPYDYEIDVDPHPTWLRMREEQPLYWNERYQFFALSRFEDVWAAYHDTKTFSSAHGVQLRRSARRSTTRR